jgi:methionyl-tRNA synthetase
MSADRFYISTPIYYVNDRPHIGHIYTTTIADIVARTHRLAGEDVFFLTGTDEHAAKVVDAAAERGLETRVWADQNAASFRDTFAEFGIANDDFIRTSEPRHIEFVEKVIADLVESGDVYLGEYEGWYDASQEEYVPEARAKEYEYCSPVTRKPLVRRTEENFFFRLSAYAEPMLALHQRTPAFVRPAARQNEMIARIREGLADVPISRTGGGDWGVRFPDRPDHLIYVWIDALLNYASAVATEERRARWPADVHLIAKDILWFHSVIWPAVLMALQKVPGNEWLKIPGMVYSHSFWISEGQKMSKSLGNFVDLEQLHEYRDTFGLDALRFYLATQGPIETVDSDFARARFIEVYNSDLANTVGNSWNRIANMTERYCGGRLPRAVDGAGLASAVSKIGAREDHNALRLGSIQKGVDIVKAIDGYIQETQPFKLAKEPANRAQVEDILYRCAESYRIASLYLCPALTEKMPEVWRRCGLDYEKSLADRGRGDFASWVQWGGLAEGTELAKGDALYPRYTEG